METVEYNSLSKNVVRDIFRVKVGKEYYDFVNNKLLFGESCVPQSYLSIASPFSSNAVVYGNTNNNMCAALHGRIFGIRTKNGMDEEQPDGYDSILRDNQRLFIQNHTQFFLDYTRDFVFYGDESYDVIALNMIYAELPHDKRELRVREVMDLLSTGRVFTPDWGKYLTRLKLKLHEFAKNGKMPRGIADLGCGRSLVGSYLMDQIKDYLSRTVLNYGNSRCVFIKSVSHKALKLAFEDILCVDDVYSVVSYVHSDDALIRITNYDTILKRHVNMVFNMDISKCDMSHTSHLFKLLARMFANNTGGMLDRLVEQCKCDFVVYSDDMTKKIIFTLLDYVLLSGSTLTTAINTLANQLIFIAIVLNKPTNGSELLKAVEQCGYVVTAGEDYADRPSMWQFLKVSPIIHIEYGIVPIFNLGPLFRRMGNVVGDFIGPSGMDIVQRADSHVSAMVNSMYGDGVTFGFDVPFLNFLRSQYKNYLSGKHLELLYNSIDNCNKLRPDKVLFRLTDEEFFQRYLGDGIGLGDLEDLYSVIAGRIYGCSMYSTLADRVLERDYGLNVQLIP